MILGCGEVEVREEVEVVAVPLRNTYIGMSLKFPSVRAVNREGNVSLFAS